MGKRTGSTGRKGGAATAGATRTQPTAQAAAQSSRSARKRRPAAPRSRRALPKSVDERKADIIEAARELYDERGMARTTIKDIAERVGVTRSLFYHYFPNKDAVTSAVMDTYVADFVELLQHWNETRTAGDVEEGLTSIVRVLRLGLFEDGAFRYALASQENAALYLEFVNRVASHAATYIIDTTVQDYAQHHAIRISHVYETFYVLIIGVVGYLRKHPDADDAVIADVIAQTLHISRP